MGMARRRKAKPLSLMSRSRGLRHRGAAWLGVLALLIQIVVPFFHEPAPAHAETPAFPWDLSDFCLASGHLPPGYAPATSEDGPDEPQDHKVPPCSICKALQQTGHCVQPAAVSILYRLENAVRARHPTQAVAIARRTASSSQPRAPPVLP
jgi:hypothetical protein